MRALVPALALLLLPAGPLGAGTGAGTRVQDGFTWDSGPGRHQRAAAASDAHALPRAAHDVRLARAVDDLLRDERERQERVRSEVRARDAAQTERALEVWEERAERGTRAADLHQDLDAASLPLAERGALELERSVQRVHRTLERKRSADRALRRRVGTSRGRPGFLD